MQQAEIHSYLKKFFQANECEIEEIDPSYLKVQLTIDMDKALMNRPFYWHYIEKTGGVPNPQKLTLITDFNNPKNMKGEFVHFGSQRLHQIFSVTNKLGRFIRLYEKTHQNNRNENTPLLPWLCLNVRISYICDRKKDFFRSIGLNLINGMMLEDFHHHLTKIPLVAKIPDFAFTLTPLIKPVSGIKRIEQKITKEIEAEDHTWAEEAIMRWKQDEELLDHFYEDMDELPESYFNEKEALKEQYEPYVQIRIINGGLFYLKQNQFFTT